MQHHLTRTIATPHLLVSLFAVVYLLYTLYHQQPPPFWNERCIAWKTTKKDCDRCCASYGTNHVTTAMLSHFLLLLHFFKRTCQSTMQKCHSSTLLRVLLDAVVSIGLLTLPTLQYVPEHRWVTSSSDLLGFTLYCVGFVCSCCFQKGPKKAIAELLCWCGGGAMLVFSSPPIRFDTLETNVKQVYTLQKSIPFCVCLTLALIVGAIQQQATAVVLKKQN